MSFTSGSVLAGLGKCGCCHVSRCSLCSGQGSQVFTISCCSQLGLLSLNSEHNNCGGDNTPPISDNATLGNVEILIENAPMRVMSVTHFRDD